jgi:hypothetical protein
MKTEEDEAFDELAKRQGAWGGGFQAKRQAAMDKLQEPDEALTLEALKYAASKGYGRIVRENSAPFIIKEALAQPAQEPVACERCKKLEEQAYDLLGQLKAANLKWSVAHPWVGLNDKESIDVIKKDDNYKYPIKLLQAVMDALKEKNT